jgi:hypothetical protein
LENGANRAMLGQMKPTPQNSLPKIAAAPVRRLSDTLLSELIEIARDEWKLTLTQEGADELSRWLLKVYGALLKP